MVKILKKVKKRKKFWGIRAGYSETPSALHFKVPFKHGFSRIKGIYTDF